MSEGNQKDVRMTSRGCRDKDSKKIKIYLEHVQRMSRGSPEEGLGMYINKDILRMSKRASRGVQRISRGRIGDVY